MSRWRVYSITNTINSKHYVGITSKPLSVRLSEHLLAARPGRRNRNGTLYALHAAVQKHGEGAFAIEELEDDLELNDARAREVFFIQELNAYGGGKDRLGIRRGYNQTLGGEMPDFDELQYASSALSIPMSERSSEPKGQTSKASPVPRPTSGCLWATIVVVAVPACLLLVDTLRG
jgi:hypothetical protein